MSLLTNKQSKKIWDSVLGKLELRIPRPSFNTWLKETKGVCFDSDLFFVSVPDAFTASYLEERMLGISENEISDILKKEVKLNIPNIYKIQHGHKLYLTYCNIPSPSKKIYIYRLSVI